jgi:hypothetical protein
VTRGGVAGAGVTAGRAGLRLGLSIHEERGPTSFRLATETIAGHDWAHLLRLDQAITALQR